VTLEGLGLLLPCITPLLLGEEEHRTLAAIQTLQASPPSPSSSLLLSSLELSDAKVYEP